MCLLEFEYTKRLKAHSQAIPEDFLLLALYNVYDNSVKYILGIKLAWYFLYHFVFIVVQLLIWYIAADMIFL